MIEIKIAKKIRQLRLERGMTQDNLASKIGFSKAFISKIENHITSPSIASLSKIAMALGVSISALLDENPGENQDIILVRKGQRKKIVGPGSDIGFAYESLAYKKKRKGWSHLSSNTRLAVISENSSSTMGKRCSSSFRGKSTHSTPRSKARGMLRVDTERRFLPRFKNRGLAPSNVSSLFTEIKSLFSGRGIQSILIQASLIGGKALGIKKGSASAC